MSRCVALLLACVLCAACGTEDEGPSPSVLADLSELHRLIERDPAVEPLELVERRIDDQRPVHAGQMLRTTGVPAARRQVEAIEGASLGTGEGRRFQRRLRDAYRARVTALEAHQIVLEGGVAVDPLEQLTAMRGVRLAQEELLGVVREMSALVPRPETAAEGPEEPAEGMPEGDTGEGEPAPPLGPPGSGASPGSR